LPGLRSATPVYALLPIVAHDLHHRGEIGYLRDIPALAELVRLALAFHKTGFDHLFIHFEKIL
jgi:hypothetical protein